MPYQPSPSPAHLFEKSALSAPRRRMESTKSKSRRVLVFASISILLVTRFAEQFSQLPSAPTKKESANATGQGSVSCNLSEVEELLPAILIARVFPGDRLLERLAPVSSLSDVLPIVDELRAPRVSVSFFPPAKFKPSIAKETAIQRQLHGGLLAAGSTSTIRLSSLARCFYDKLPRFSRSLHHRMLSFFYQAWKIPLAVSSRGSASFSTIARLIVRTSVRSDSPFRRCLLSCRHPRPAPSSRTRT